MWSDDDYEDDGRFWWVDAALIIASVIALVSVCVAAVIKWW